MTGVSAAEMMARAGVLKYHQNRWGIFTSTEIEKEETSTFGDFLERLQVSGDDIRIIF